jgi:hypothetical protein
MFPAPTFTGERMRFTTEITGQQADAHAVRLEVLRPADGVVTCRGSTWVRS